MKVYIKKINDKEIINLVLNNDFDPSQTKKYVGFLNTDGYGNKSCELRLDKSVYDAETKTWIRG
jgi:hypothetical protein